MGTGVEINPFCTIIGREIVVGVKLSTYVQGEARKSVPKQEARAVARSMLSYSNVVLTHYLLSTLATVFALPMIHAFDESHQGTEIACIIKSALLLYHKVQLATWIRD